MFTRSDATAPSYEEPAPGLSVLVLRAAEQDVLVVLGEADVATAQQLIDQVLEALPTPPRPVIVDLGALTFCDLIGLDALRDVARAAETAGVALAFRNHRPQLRWLQRTVLASHCQRSPRAPASLDLSSSTTAASC